MLSVSNDFKTALQDPAKRVSGYLVLADGTELLPNGDLVKYAVDAKGELLKSTMSHFTASLIGEHDLIGTALDAYYGVFTTEWEYVLKGKFTITESKYKQGEDITELEGYDNMLQFQQEYTSVSDFPTNLYDYLSAVCSGAGVVLENDSIYNGALDIPLDYYVDIQDTTFRDVLEDICEVTGNSARIAPNGNLLLETIVETGETLTYDNLLSYSLGEKYGGINSLVLSRQPQNDDVFLQDEVDINTPTTRNILDLNKFEVTYTEGEA